MLLAYLIADQVHLASVVETAIQSTLCHTSGRGRGLLPQNIQGANAPAVQLALSIQSAVPVATGSRGLYFHVFLHVRHCLVILLESIRCTCSFLLAKGFQAQGWLVREHQLDADDKIPSQHSLALPPVQQLVSLPTECIPHTCLQ